jgi:hypothetical protein
MRCISAASEESSVTARSVPPSKEKRPVASTLVAPVVRLARSTMKRPRSALTTSSPVTGARADSSLPAAPSKRASSLPDAALKFVPGKLRLTVPVAAPVRGTARPEKVARRPPTSTPSKFAATEEVPPRGAVLMVARPVARPLKMSATKSFN